MSIGDILAKSGNEITRQQEGILRARGNPRRVCGAPTLQGHNNTCRNWAGFRTDHPGQGFCFLHDGQLPDSEPEGAIEPSGGSLLANYFTFLHDTDYLSLDREIALARAAVHSLTRRKKLDPQATAQLSTMMTALAKLMAVNHKIALDRRYLVELPQVMLLVDTMVALSRRYIPDDGKRREFAEAIGEAVKGLDPREPRLPAF